MFLSIILRTLTTLRKQIIFELIFNNWLRTSCQSEDIECWVLVRWIVSDVEQVDWFPICKNIAKCIVFRLGSKNTWLFGKQLVLIYNYFGLLLILLLYFSCLLFFFFILAVRLCQTWSVLFGSLHSFFLDRIGITSTLYLRFLITGNS